MEDTMNTNITRSRWAAIGAAVAVTLGAGGIGLVSATSPAGAAAYVPITPCRVADTRPQAEFNTGPRNTPIGQNETHTVTAHGNNGDCTGIPTTATGVQLNVTALNATTGTFLTIWGAGARPDASSLNPGPGQPPTPNAVTSGLTAAGVFSIYNAFGSVNVIVDIVGYYTDHNHDDRYYTETEVNTALGTKANSTDVYTKAQTDGIPRPIAAAHVSGAGTLGVGFGVESVNRTDVGRYQIKLPGISYFFSSYMTVASASCGSGAVPTVNVGSLGGFLTITIRDVGAFSDCSFQFVTYRP
ncbi:MAG: hypothetical protein ABIP17_02750 [Ilumatobacteraceae bacterium]